MSTLSAFSREIKFAGRDRAVWIWLILVFGLSVVAVCSGVTEVRQQNETIESLVKADREDRLAEIDKQKDWGSAAYYSFHLTYDRPSSFAFAAMGQRDEQPWKHRIRMLALEGQIYERDVGNPSIALIGRFDFAFLAAFIVPLVLIMLLYDLRASEKAAGRYEWLEATVGRPLSLWLMRAWVRICGLFLSLVVPLIIAGMVFDTPSIVLLLACLWVLLYIIFWAALCFSFSAWRRSSSVILMTLVSVWISTAVILPAGARLVIDRLISVTLGSEILMQQREAVNDAWDIPRAETMNVFFEHHPQWSDYQQQGNSFEWQWYYAFQQVGDQAAEELSVAYRNGKEERARLARWASLLAPPSLLERSLQALARTDLRASIEYENRVRAYHRELREFYYPKFFRSEPFDKSLLDNLPTFESTP